MQTSFFLNLTLSSIFCLSSVLSLAFPLQAETVKFDEEEIAPENVVAIARPLRGNNYDLLVLVQIGNKFQCWQKQNTTPVQIDPLLLYQSDFTGNCERSTDSNGYSIRINGKDLGLDYFFKIVEHNKELWLIGFPRTNDLPKLIIGRTYGIGSGLIKIFLNPGWKMTKRVYQGATLSHIYFSTSMNVAQLSAYPQQNTPNEYSQYPQQNTPNEYSQYPQQNTPNEYSQYPQQNTPNEYSQYPQQNTPNGYSQYPQQNTPNGYSQYPQQINTPDGYSQYPQQNTPNGYSQYPQQNTPNGYSQYPQQNTPNGYSQYPQQNTPNGYSQYPQQNTPNEYPQYPQQNTPNGYSQYPQQNTPNGYSQYPQQNTSNEYPQQNTPNGYSQYPQQNTSNEYPQYPQQNTSNGYYR